MNELVIDPNIRLWVFLPIVFITFICGIIRHYVTILNIQHKKLGLVQVEDSQAIIRSRLLRDNGRYLTAQSFFMRKHFFNDLDVGHFKNYKPPAKTRQATIPLTDMVKDNAFNVMPTLALGGLINWMFSGFVTTKVPFPLTLRFKSMLQRGIELSSLDAAWVSSVSWYFLNIFGIRGIFTLVLGENNYADHTQTHYNSMAGPPDSKSAFKSEWEALEMTVYHDALKYVELDIIRMAAADEAYED